jgi:hypothetical protein
MKSTIRKKLRADWSQGILAIFWCRIFCLPGCYSKIQRFRYTELWFWLICMGVKLVDQIEKNEMGGACNMYGGRWDVHTGLWWGNQREWDHVGNTGVNGRIILRWIFRKWDGGHGLDWLAQDKDRWLTASCEHSNEPWGSIKCGEFLDCMRTG